MAFLAGLPAAAAGLRAAPSCASTRAEAHAATAARAPAHSSFTSTANRVQFSSASRFYGKRVVRGWTAAGDACRAARFVVEANLGADALFLPAKILKNETAAEDHHAITIEVTVPSENREAFGTYRLPGQFVQIKTSDAGKAGFFAVASPPFIMDDIDKNDDGSISFQLEFLIKRADGTAGEICDAKAGDEVQVSQFMGKGFNIMASLPIAAVSTVIFMATGSGIAPIRACIEADAPDSPGSFELRQREDVRLYYGSQKPARMAYQDRFAAWEDIGVKVSPVISQADGTDWKGATGYVQAALKADGVKDPSSTVIVMCGVKGMAEDVKALAAEWGIPADRVLTNF